MPIKQQIFAVLTTFLMFFIIIYLIKGKKLREEYSWLWLSTGGLLLLLVFNYEILIILTKLIGASVPTTTLFILGIVFLMLVSLHAAIRISTINNQVKNLAQKISLLEKEIDEVAGGSSLLVDNKPGPHNQSPER